LDTNNIDAFLKVLDPRDNSTGGGTASAVAGAMAGGLVAMVARLSAGKPGMESNSFYANIDGAASRLSMELFDGGRQDSEAFGSVGSAYRMPKETEADKEKRSAAIQASWEQAAQIPILNAQRCAEVLELAQRLSGCSNLNAASDLECAVHLARAGLLGCVANVEINLSSIKDQDLASELAELAYELRASAES